MKTSNRAIRKQRAYNLGASNCLVPGKDWQANRGRLVQAGRAVVISYAAERIENMKHMVWKCCLLFAIVHTAVPLHAQQTPAAAPSSQSVPSAPQASNSTNEKLAQLDQRVTAAQSSADNAWMLVSAALVLMMTGPGLALFYGGLVRRKNTLAIMMQSFMLMGVITVMWALVGYSLCFGGNGPVIGGFEHAFFWGVGAGAKPGYVGTSPQMALLVFPVMFFLLTPP